MNLGGKTAKLASMGKNFENSGDEGLREDSGPMPTTVPNFLVKTYEIVNVSRLTRQRCAKRWCTLASSAAAAASSTQKNSVNDSHSIRVLI